MRTEHSFQVLEAEDRAVNKIHKAGNEAACPGKAAYKAKYLTPCKQRISPTQDTHRTHSGGSNNSKVDLPDTLLQF